MGKSRKWLGSGGVDLKLRRSSVSRERSRTAFSNSSFEFQVTSSRRVWWLGILERDPTYRFLIAESVLYMRNEEGINSMMRWMDDIDGVMEKEGWKGICEFNLELKIVEVR